MLLISKGPQSESDRARRVERECSKLAKMCSLVAFRDGNQLTGDSQLQLQVQLQVLSMSFPSIVYNSHTRLLSLLLNAQL